jgi:hypothetical protein
MTAAAAIGAAATKAVLLWIVFYVLLLHGFVVWKWDSVSITINNEDPSVSWNNNKVIMNSNNHAAMKAQRRAARKEELRAQRQHAAAKKDQASRNYERKKEAFLQAARSVRAEERAKQLQEKKAAAVEVAWQERRAQRVLRQEQALLLAAENRAARQKAAYEQALAERAELKLQRQQARRLERVTKARMALLAERKAAKEAARAAAAHRRANSTMQQVQEEEQLRVAIHAQQASIETQEAYVRALTDRLQRVTEARARLVQESHQELHHTRRRQLDLEQALQQQIDQASNMALSSSFSIVSGGDSPHQLDPLVAWLQKQVEVEETDMDKEGETTSTYSSDLLLLHPTVDDLSQQFDYIDNVLQHQIQQAATVNWRQIHDLLRNEYPSKEKITSLGRGHAALYCSHAREAAIMATIAESTNNNNNNNASGSDDGEQEFILSSLNLAQRLQAAVRMMQNNATTLDQMVDQVPIYFTETYNNIYAKLDAAMESWLERVGVAFRQYEEEQLEADVSLLVDRKESSSSTTAEIDESVGGGGGGNCVSMDQVHELLRDGLDALNSNQDLRQALLHGMSMLHMNVSSIILDATLPGDGNGMQKLRDAYDDSDDDDSDTTGSSSATRSLRELLDRPVTHEMATWINVALDMISGHFDGMDRFLDEKIPAGVDVGEYVVHRLLELAGTYGDRHVMARIGRIIPKRIKQSFR